MGKIPDRAGIGLRHPHLRQILESTPDVAWLEVHSENFFDFGAHTRQLDKIAEHYPLSFHGIGLSLGSADPLDASHLQKLKTAIARYSPDFVSEHLSWSGIDGHHFNDLLPLPYNEESLRHFADKIKKTQDYLNRQILIENPSAYLQFPESDIPEWEFYAALPSLTGCGLLLDVNNIYVNGKNFGFDPELYLGAVAPDDVAEIHLAGHAVNHYQKGDIYIDDHGGKISDAVWDLFKKTIDDFGTRPTLVEWDTNIPPLSVLLGEAKKSQRILDAWKNPDHFCERPLQS